MHGIVAERHVVRPVSLEPLNVGVAEEDVLPVIVRLPLYRRRPVGLAPNAILRVVILVIVVGQEILRTINGVAAQDIRRREVDPAAADRCALKVRGHIGDPHAIEVVERGPVSGGQLGIAGAMENVRVLYVVID